MRRGFEMAVLAALVALGACGAEESRGRLTAEEERALDNASAMLDDNMIDASPDSLVANAAELEAGEEAPPAPEPAAAANQN